VPRGRQPFCAPAVGPGPAEGVGSAGRRGDGGGANQVVRYGFPPTPTPSISHYIPYTHQHTHTHTHTHSHTPDTMGGMPPREATTPATSWKLRRAPAARSARTAAPTAEPAGSEKFRARACVVRSGEKQTDFQSAAAQCTDSTAPCSAGPAFEHTRRRATVGGRTCRCLAGFSRLRY
jgi:hypothetical protein